MTPARKKKSRSGFRLTRENVRLKPDLRSCRGKGRPLTGAGPDYSIDGCPLAPRAGPRTDRDHGLRNRNDAPRRLAPRRFELLPESAAGGLSPGAVCGRAVRRRQFLALLPAVPAGAAGV